MKYCCTELERKGTCYHEFQKGRFNDSFWEKDSLLIHDDIFYNLDLSDLFYSVVPSYDESGETEITLSQWNEICFRASEIGGEIKVAIKEVDSWAKTIFENYDVFTIIGV